MFSIMNSYVNNIKLQTDDVMKAVFNASLINIDAIDKFTIHIKSNRYVIDIHMKSFSIEGSSSIMNAIRLNCSYHYSSYYVRYNEGNLVRYRFASCKENKEGFYCDIVIS